MTNAANFNDYSGDGVFGRDKYALFLLTRFIDALQLRRAISIHALGKKTARERWLLRRQLQALIGHRVDATS